MIRKYISLCSLITLSLFSYGQDNMHPAPANTGTFYIVNATVHTGTGTVLSNATIEITKDKITKVGAGISAPAGSKTIDAAGRQVYPGIILSNSNLGLREIGAAVRGSNDYREIGDVNPNVRSIVAYNTDSKIINTLRSNGILLADVVPEGSLLTGSSSIVQLDGWSWEEAAYKLDNGIHLDMPSLMIRQGRQPAENSKNPLEGAYQQIDYIKNFFRAAKAYQEEKTHEETNLKLESVKGLFDNTQTLFVHCDRVKEMLVSVDFAREFGFKVCIVGGRESYQIAPLLAQNKLSVILNTVHDLPELADDDVDQPFKTPFMLQRAGVQFAITDIDEHTIGRNIMFTAGTASAYGLTKEQALQAITLSAANILGIGDRTGSIEVGKDANIIISEGDILDMRTSKITHAFIQGRNINLDDKHQQLDRKYEEKYGIKGK